MKSRSWIRRKEENADAMIFDRLGWENSLGLSPYSSRFRAYRKTMAKVLGSQIAVSRFHALQEAEVGRFLLRLLETPEDLLEHIRKSVFPFCRYA
jgi:hypothetical protein